MYDVKSIRMTDHVDKHARSDEKILDDVLRKFLSKRNVRRKPSQVACSTFTYDTDIYDGLEDAIDDYIEMACNYREPFIKEWVDCGDERDRREVVGVSFGDECVGHGYLIKNGKIGLYETNSVVVVLDRFAYGDRFEVRTAYPGIDDASRLLADRQDGRKTARTRELEDPGIERKIRDSDAFKSANPYERQLLLSLVPGRREQQKAAQSPSKTSQKTKDTEKSVREPKKYEPTPIEKQKPKIIHRERPDPLPSREEHQEFSL